MRLHAVAVTMALAVAGCSAPADAPGASGTGATPHQSTVPFALPTHCGIDDVHFQGRYYEAVVPLTDGGKNPPAGWDNPEQHGEMRVVNATEVEFRDAKGHVVLFRLRPQATAPKDTCL